VVLTCNVGQVKMATTNKLIIPLLLLVFVTLSWSRIIREDTVQGNNDQGNNDEQGNVEQGNNDEQGNDDEQGEDDEQYDEEQGNDEQYDDEYGYDDVEQGNNNDADLNDNYQNYGSNPQSIVQSMLQNDADAVHIERTEGFNGVNDYQPPGLEIEVERPSKSDEDEDTQEAPNIYTEGVGPALMNGCFEGEYSPTDPCSRFMRKAKKCRKMLEAANFVGVGFDGRGFYSSDSRKMNLIQRTCEKGIKFLKHRIPDSMAAYGLWDYSVSTDTYSDAKHYVKHLQEKSGSMDTESMFKAESDAISDSSSTGITTAGLFAIGGAALGAYVGGPAGAMQGLEMGNALQNSIGGSINFGSKSGKQSGNTNSDSSSAQSSSMSNSNSDTSATNMLAVMEADVKLYQLALGEMKPDDLSVEFYSSLIDLPTSYFDLGADVKYQEFILRWGTHYVHAAKFGGRLSVIKKSKKESKMNHEAFAEHAQDEFSSMLGTMRSSMKQKSSGWKILGVGSEKKSSKSHSKNTQENKAGRTSSSSEGNSKSSKNSEFVQTTLKVVGGNPAVAAAITSMFSPKFGSDFQKWLKTIDEYVRPIDFSLSSISDLALLNVEYLFASGISKEGCFTDDKKFDKEKGMYYFERNVTKKDENDDTFTETVRNYCKYKNEKKELIADLRNKKLAIERAKSIYMTEGPFSTSNFDIEGGNPGCEFDNLEYQDQEDNIMTSWPSFEEMKKRVFRAIFEMPQDLPFVKRNSEFLVKFYKNRWYTKSPQPGARFDLALSCPFRANSIMTQKDTNGKEIEIKHVCIAQLPLQYSEEDGLLKLDVDVYRKFNDVYPKFNVTLPAWLGVEEPLGYVQILEQYIFHDGPAKPGQVGLVPCNIKWYNAHQINVKSGNKNGKCLYFKAASAGGIHIVFAGLPENKKTWISLRLSSGSVTFYRAMVLEKIDAKNIHTGTTGSATLFEAYFICLVQSNHTLTLNFGKSRENSELGDYYSTHLFEEMGDFDKYFYAFGSGDKTISISDLRIAKGHSNVTCRNGLTKTEFETCEIVCHPQCLNNQCNQANSANDCYDCKNFEIITGEGTKHCAEWCPEGFRLPVEGKCICPSGHGVLKAKLSTSEFQCEKCPGGTKSNGHLCKECPENTYSEAGRDECLPCWTGQSSKPGSATCDREVLKLIPLHDTAEMVATTGKANLAFATTSSKTWKPDGDDTKPVIFYRFRHNIEIAKFAFSAGKKNVKLSFKFIGQVHCPKRGEQQNENWETIMDIGSVTMKALSLNFWYVPKESRKKLGCFGLKFDPLSPPAVTNLRMWKKWLEGLDITMQKTYSLTIIHHQRVKHGRR